MQASGDLSSNLDFFGGKSVSQEGSCYLRVCFDSPVLVSKLKGRDQAKDRVGEDNKGKETG